jgi:hypothetical protein
MKKNVLVTADDFGSSKTNPGQSPKHHFCCGDMGKKVKYRKRGDLGKYRGDMKFSQRKLYICY